MGPTGKFARHQAAKWNVRAESGGSPLLRSGKRGRLTNPMGRREISGPTNLLGWAEDECRMCLSENSEVHTGTRFKGGAEKRKVGPLFRWYEGDILLTDPRQQPLTNRTFLRKTLCFCGLRYPKHTKRKVDKQPRVKAKKKLSHF